MTIVYIIVGIILGLIVVGSTLLILYWVITSLWRMKKKH